MAGNRNRKFNEPIRDKTHESTGPFTGNNPRKLKGNPTKGGKVFGNRTPIRKVASR